MTTQTQNPTLTVEEMNAKYQSSISVIEQIENVLQEKLASGPAAAQANRLVAMGLAKQANAMLENVGSTLQYLNTPEFPVDAETNNPLAALVHVAEEIVEALMDQFGVEKEAVVPFIYGMNAIMLPVIDDLLTKAQEKLTEANALTEAANVTA